MNYSLSSLVMTLAGKSTIPPDQRDLSAATVASVVITGLVVVFIGLILLILLVAAYGKIFDLINKRNAENAKLKENSESAVVKKAEVKVETTPAAPVIEDGIEEETVAVIMAAVSAMSSSSGKNLVLKSVKTAKPQRSAWSSAGLIENTRPF